MKWPSSRWTSLGDRWFKPIRELNSLLNRQRISTFRISDQHVHPSLLASPFRSSEGTSNSSATFGMTNFTDWRTRVLLYAGRPNWILLATASPA